MSTSQEITGARINELALRAMAWVRRAPPAELWAVLQGGGIDTRVGMAGAMSGLGALSGPGPFEHDLANCSWGPPAGIQDFEAWFLSNREAQEGARRAMHAEITEVAFDLGEWDWSTSSRGHEAA